MILHPGTRYRAAIGTLTRAGGALPVDPSAVLRAVGDTFAVTAETQLQATELCAITSNAALTPAPLAESVLAGATAALRRVVNTVGTTAAPALSTDGHSTLGASVAHITMTNGAGPVDFQLYGYDEVSAAWAVVLDFGTAGTKAAGVSETNRINLDVRGYDRLYLRVPVNAGLVQASAWIAVVI